MKITNNSGISLEMAVWLLHDDYDFIAEENYISATGLMKPLRHIILPSRIAPADKIAPDVSDFISAALGHSLHAAIENAWRDPDHVARALKRLGIPKEVADRVLVNPGPKELAIVKDAIPVYIEQRAIREIAGFKVGGKFDMVCEHRIRDTKSTSVWTWIYGGKDNDYKLQMSIYRWLNPDKITDDVGQVNFIFTDWDKRDAKYKADRGYPPKRIMDKLIPLMSLAETEQWIRNKLALVESHYKTPEPELPECTDEELWMSAPKYKYYSDPAKIRGKSTKNFESLVEAEAFCQEKGKGVVITVPGAPKRCDYCAAYPICTQKDRYIHD
jgi:hypothetical protein